MFHPVVVLWIYIRERSTWDFVDLVGKQKSKNKRKTWLAGIVQVIQLECSKFVVETVRIS